MTDNIESSSALVAGVIERSIELISEGWIKHALHNDTNAPTQFCIMGALELSAMEILGCKTLRYGNRQVVNTARDVICEFANKFTNAQNDDLGRAHTKTQPLEHWNDSNNRSKHEVLSVLRKSADYFWDISLNNNSNKFSNIAKPSTIVTTNIKNNANSISA